MKSSVPWLARTRTIFRIGILLMAVVLTPIPTALFSSSAIAAPTPQIQHRLFEEEPETNSEEAPQTPIAHEVKLVVVVPLSLPPASSGLLSEAELEPRIAEDGLLTRLLNLAIEHQLSVAIDPYLVRSLLTAESEQATGFLDDLRFAPVEKFLMSYANAPVGYLQQFPNLEDILDGNRMALEKLDLSSPILRTPVSTVWSPHVPLTADFWPIITEQATRIIVPQAQLNQDALTKQGLPAYTPVEQLDQQQYYYVHQAADEAFNRYLRTGSDDDYNTFIRLVRLDLPAEENTLVIVPNFSERLPRTLERLAMQFNVTLLSLQSLPEHPVSTASILSDLDPAALDESLLSDAQSALESNSAAQSFLNILNDPTVTQTQFLLQALQALSEHRDDLERTEALLNYFESVSALRNSIILEPGSDITFITSETNFWVSVNNSLADSAHVVINFETNNNRLLIPDRVSVEVEPHSRQIVTVPVSTLANGSVTLSMTMFSQNGVQLGETYQLHIDIQAQVEFVALIIFFVLVFGFIVGGIIRSLRKRNRRIRSEHKTLTLESTTDSQKPSS